MTAIGVKEIEIPQLAHMLPSHASGENMRRSAIPVTAGGRIMGISTRSTQPNARLSFWLCSHHARGVPKNMMMSKLHRDVHILKKRAWCTMGFCKKVCHTSALALKGSPINGSHKINSNTNPIPKNSGDFIVQNRVGGECCCLSRNEGNQ